jgi:hypothetical protein
MPAVQHDSTTNAQACMLLLGREMLTVQPTAADEMLDLQVAASANLANDADSRCYRMTRTNPLRGISNTTHVSTHYCKLHLCAN